MSLRINIETDEDPIEQKQVAELISAGFPVDLYINQKFGPHTREVTNADKEKVSITEDRILYTIFAKERNHLRQIYTQRKEERVFLSLDRLLVWAKSVGIRRAYMGVDFANFPEREIFENSDLASQE